MKKLLVCMLVFGVSCVASAGLEYSVNGAVVDPSAGAVIVPVGVSAVSVGNTVVETGVFPGGFVQVTGPAALSEGAVVGENLPGAWEIVNVGAFDLGKGEAVVWQINWATPAVDPFGAGPLFDFSVIYEGPAEAMFDLYDIDLNPVASIAMVVPEPMTMALLGLGGLFLRRRMA